MERIHEQEAKARERRNRKEEEGKARTGGEGRMDSHGFSLSLFPPSPPVSPAPSLPSLPSSISTPSRRSMNGHASYWE